MITERELQDMIGGTGVEARESLEVIRGHLVALISANPVFSRIINTEEEQNMTARHLQEVLLADVRAILQHKKEQALYEAVGGDRDSERYRIFIEKRERLAAKWRDEQDSEERRLVGNLVFPEPLLMPPFTAAVLADHLSFYKERGWGAGEYWMKHLDLACLFGSREIGDFIISNKETQMREDDYAKFLCHIITSGNDTWAIEFARSMKTKGMSLPRSVYVVCDDRTLLDGLKGIFRITRRPTLGM